MNNKITIFCFLVMFSVLSVTARVSVEEDNAKLMESVKTSPIRFKREQWPGNDVRKPSLTFSPPPTPDFETGPSFPFPYNRRFKRATCDLLSGFGVNHSACAAHCILLGHKGGYCNEQAVCICRN